MPNALAGENSPYLLQHAENPVDWQPWGAAALAQARQEDKPIFLSIGYAACHWCHVMAHESFEDPATAALMNQHFVNIKVDREERPDLDGIYMSAVVALTGQGGWPMSVFLTPDGQPFYGGTYFPPAPRHGMPAFREVLEAISRLWREDRPRLLQSSAELAAELQPRPAATGPAVTGAAPLTLDAQQLDAATLALAQAYDWKQGGWGQAPKFPQPMTIEYLLRRSVNTGRPTREDPLPLEMALHALQAMAQGGMYDVVGGGFARYSVDNYWLVPHFEKMLYDNAQLALAYLHAHLVCRAAQPGSELASLAPFFERVCTETLDFVTRELTDPLGGFYSSLDADSDGEEGKFYVWKLAEFRAAAGSPELADFGVAAYGVTEQGNFEGHTVLQRALSDAELAGKFGLEAQAVPGRLKALHTNLLAARARRVRPGTDDKVLTAWNALALWAFAEAGRYLSRPDYLAVAQKNAAFLLTHLHPSDRLLRSWRAGQARHNAYLEDYAGLVLALLALYQSDADPQWYAAALRLAGDMVSHYTDSQGGFFDTRDDHESLLFRPKDTQDNATPSGSALAALALLQLAAYGDRPAWRDPAEAMLHANLRLMVRYPTAFAQWLCAADFALGPVFEVAIVGADRAELTRTLWQAYRPRLVAALALPPPLTDSSPTLLQDRPLKDGRPTAYVCQGFVCQQPVTTPAELRDQLNAWK